MFRETLTCSNCVYKVFPLKNKQNVNTSKIHRAPQRSRLAKNINKLFQLEEYQSG